MIITTANIDRLFIAFETKWSQVYSVADAWFNKVAYTQPSGTEITSYAWMARIPTMRQWLGERVANNVTGYSTDVKNLDYELSLVVDRNKIEDDQYDVFANPLLVQMGVQTKKQPDYLIATLLHNANSTLTWDNQNFFDPAHPIDMRNPALGTQTNYFTSKALSYDNYASVRTTMMSYLGEDGKPLKINPSLLVVPPQLEGMAKQILNSDTIAVGTVNGATQVGGQTNIWKSSADLLVVPELGGDPTTWYLLDTTKPIKPFVWQVRKPAEFTYLNNPNDLPVYQRREFNFGVHLRGAAATTLWFLASKCVA